MAKGRKKKRAKKEKLGVASVISCVNTIAASHLCIFSSAGIMCILLPTTHALFWFLQLM